MKTKLAVLICLGLAIDPHASAANLFRQDSVRSELKPADGRTQITMTVGLFPFGFLSDERSGWYPKIAVGTGLTFPVARDISLCTKVDYYLYEPSSTGNSSFSSNSVKRQDIAISAAIQIGNFFEVGCGGYYTTSDEVNIQYFFPSDTLRWSQSGWSAVKFYFTAGFFHKFELTDRLFLPVGLYYRDAGYGSGTGPYFIRGGFGVRL